VPVPKGKLLTLLGASLPEARPFTNGLNQWLTSIPFNEKGIEKLMFCRKIKPFKSHPGMTVTGSRKSPLRIRVPWSVIGLMCLLFGVSPRMQAQVNLNMSQGTIFTPALEKVTQSGPSVVLPSLRLEGTYDSNLVTSQSGRLASGYGTVEGEGRYSLQHGSDDLLLTFIGGGRFYPQYPNLNAAIQDGRLQWQHNFSSRSNFAVTGRFAKLPEGIFQQGNPSQNFPLLGSGDTSALFLQHQVEISDGTVSWQQGLSAHTTLVLGDNYNLTKYFGNGLVDTREQDAYGGINFTLSDRQSVGLQYAHQWMAYSQDLGRSQVHDAFLSYSAILSKEVSIQLFAGPALVSQTAVVTSSSTTVVGLPTSGLNAAGFTKQDVAGGGTLIFEFGRNKIQGQFTRLITGGSGFSTTVLRQSGTLKGTRAITTRLNLGLEVSYSGNRPLGVANAQFKIYYLEPTIHYQLTPHLQIELRGSAGRVTGLSQLGSVDRNQATVQLEYQFREIPIKW
jgi:hypothetical protein